MCARWVRDLVRLPLFLVSTGDRNFPEILFRRVASFRRFDMHTLAHAASRRSGSGPGMAPGRRPGTVSQDDDGESGGRFPTKPSGGWVSESDDEAAPPADPVVRKRVTRVTRGAGGAYWYRRVAYVTDSYLSQSVYQSYALIAGAVALTVSGGFGYHGIDDTVGYLDGMWATFTCKCCVSQIPTRITRALLPIQYTHTRRRKTDTFLLQSQGSARES